VEHSCYMGYTVEWIAIEDGQELKGVEMSMNLAYAFVGSSREGLLYNM